MPLRPPFNFNMQMSGAPADRNRAGGLLAANLPQLNRYPLRRHMGPLLHLLSLPNTYCAGCPTPKVQ
jgi:hypothetical protein